MNYARMPGPGDLPGDSRNSNSPDYVEPEYSEDDAECDVAIELTRNGNVTDLVSDMRILRALLAHLEGVSLPWDLRAAAKIGRDRIRQLDRMVEAKIQEWSP